MITEQMGIFDALLVEAGEDRLPNPGHKLKSKAAPKPSKRHNNLARADRFEELAEAMQSAIDHKFADRQENTAKRMGQAAGARADGERLKRVQQGLRVIAGLHRAGECPEILATIKTKKDVHNLMAGEMVRVGNGFHDYMNDTGKPREGASEQALALWALLDGKTPEQEKAEELAQMERDLQFSKIPGYFPTPDAVIDLMLDYAQIEAHHTILEPSAGSGAIVDRLPDDNLVVVYEINPTLCQILQAKGFDARPVDFLTEIEGAFQFDRVLMNPPFENQADIDHVLEAFGRLQSGGRLVAVMSPSPFFRDNSKSTIFRAFLETHTSEVIDLPDGSFKESGTGVASKLVIIDKE